MRFKERAVQIIALNNLELPFCVQVRERSPSVQPDVDALRPGFLLGHGSHDFSPLKLRRMPNAVQGAEIRGNRITGV